MKKMKPVVYVLLVAAMFVNVIASTLLGADLGVALWSNDKESAMFDIPAEFSLFTLAALLFILSTVCFLYFGKRLVNHLITKKW